MGVQVEKLEKNMAKLTVEVSAEEVEKAIQVAMQNVAAGSDPAAELATVQSVQDMQ